MKTFSIVYVIIALVMAMTTTFMQVQPALFFIGLMTGDDNMFSLKGAILLTMLALLLPLLIILVIAKMLNKNKNVMPDLFGKTGIVIRRKKALSNAIHDTGILINDELKSSVSNGKSTFIELLPGKYIVQIKGYKSSAIEVQIPRSAILNLQLSFVDSGLKSTVLLENIEDTV